MRLSTQRITLTKRHALTISRGTTAGSTNVVVQVDHDGIVGIGEMAPSDVTGDTAESAEQQVAEWQPLVEAMSPVERQRIGELVGNESRGSAVRAALDLALFDWIGMRADLPVWRMLGADPSRIAPTSLTVGINPPDVIRDVVPEILHRTGALVLKVKLGQSAGLDADEAMFVAAQEAATRADYEVLWRVDANGGWDLAGARRMSRWLAERDVELLEQPLPQGAEEDLIGLHETSPLPIFADESIRTSADVAALADRVHGVNLKLMKCGGIDEALRIIHTARAHGLSVMIGCMGESSLAISAGAQLASFVDCLDLDSHLNLLDDPFEGATYADGTVRPSNRPGLGVVWRGGVSRDGVSRGGVSRGGAR